MKGMCEVPLHPRGEATGEVVRENPISRYVEVICPKCGRVQGIRRIRKDTEA